MKREIAAPEYSPIPAACHFYDPSFQFITSLITSKLKVYSLWKTEKVDMKDITKFPMITCELIHHWFYQLPVKGSKSVHILAFNLFRCSFENEEAPNKKLSSTMMRNILLPLWSPHSFIDILLTLFCMILCFDQPLGFHLSRAHVKVTFLFSWYL